MRDLTELTIAFNTKSECIWVKTYEEADFITDLRQLVIDKYSNYTLRIWSNTEGLLQVNTNSSWNGNKIYMPEDSKAKEFPSLFDAHIVPACQTDDGSNTIWVLRDFHQVITNPKAMRYIRDLKEYQNKKKGYNPILILSPTVTLPDDVARLFKVIDYSLPTHEDIVGYIKLINDKVKKGHEHNSAYIPLTDEEIEEYARSCAGITHIELNNILKESVTKHFTISKDAISARKIEAVRKTGSLSYKEPKITLANIGGHEVLKEWLNRQIKIINNKDIAKKFGRKPPKGYMAVGIPGAGKSAIAEAFAGEMKVPLLVFDMSKIMNRMVGESEKGIAKALETAANCSPCVLLLDEVEKALGGYASSATTDSGVTDRIVGALCSWMQDNEDVFIIMTSNNAAKLPPEFTRSGRLESTWFFGFPTKEERAEILNVQLKKVGKELTDEQKQIIIEITDHYTGAEIEQGIQNALGYSFEDYLEGGSDELTDAQLSKGFNDVIPIYRSSKGAMDALVKYYTSGEGKARLTNKINDDVDSDVEESNQEERWTLDF